jgi:hypothetical protein
MAIQTRYVGDSNGVVNVDNNLNSIGTGAIIATGLTKPPMAFKITATSSAGNIALETVTGGAVETILRNIGVDSTVVMYQVETTGGTTSNQISVLLEASGAGAAGSATTAGTNSSPSTIATALTTRLSGLNSSGNIGVAGNIWAAGISVTSSGFKLA